MRDGMKNRMRNCRGFTLLEVLIATAIVGILTLIGFSNLFLWLDHNNHLGFQRETLSEFQEARTRAIATRLQHRLIINMDAGRVYVEQGNAGSASDNWVSLPLNVNAPRGSSIDFVRRSQGGTTTDNTSGTVSIVFNPSGDTFPVDNASVRLREGGTGASWTIRLYGWTSKARLINGWP